MARDFTADEIAEIRRLVAEKVEASRDDQKRIRHELRTQYDFRISDLERNGTFTAEDLDRNIADGSIRVRNFWLFQANPARWNLREQLQDMTVGGTDGWSVTRFGSEMNEGDGVVLWSSGSEAGVYALAEIDGPVFDRPYTGFADAPPSEGNTEPAVPIRITRILSQPILRSQLRDHPVLGGVIGDSFADGNQLPGDRRNNGEH